MSRRRKKLVPADAGGPELPAPEGIDYRELALCVLLLLAAVLVFGQTLGFPFVNCDDEGAVYENPRVTGRLTAGAIIGAFTDRYLENWAPLTTVSHMLAWQAYGPNAGQHHMINVVLHGISAGFLFLVFRRMSGRLWPSALAATLFALHPLHVESVAWVTERKDVLSGLFFVLTLSAYERYTRSGRFSLTRYLMVIMLFTLSLAAKPTAVTLPFLLLLLDYWPLGRLLPSPSGAGPGVRAGTPAVAGEGPGVRAGGYATVLLEKVPLLAITCVFCIVALSRQQANEVLIGAHSLTLPWRIGNATVSYVAYIAQIFYPASLAIPYPRRAELPWWEIAGAAAVLLTVTGAALLWWRRRPYLLVGWLWYLGMMVPMIGLVQFGAQSEADRFTYLTQIGLYLALAWAGADLCRSWPSGRWAAALASALALMAATGCAWRQTGFWRDSETLWEHSLACQAAPAMPHFGLGECLAHDKDRWPMALAHYRLAMEIDPNNPSYLLGFGRSLSARGQYPEAVAVFQKALKLNPGYLEVHGALGDALMAQGRLDEAVAEYRVGLKINAESPEAHGNLALALAKQGDYAEAIAEHRTYLTRRAGDPRAQDHLARLLAACPDARLRNAKEAMNLAMAANQATRGGRADFLDTLAMAYAEAGRFDEAVTMARRAEDLAGQQKQEALAKEIAARVALYSAKKPYRLSPCLPQSPKKQ